jgi:hypothetical protein
MNKLNINDVTQYVENNIGDFHRARLEKLKSIKLKEVLLKKNPYLFKAKNVATANEIIEGILTAFLSSSEEGMFGNWLEGLAIFINQKVYAGNPGIAGLDLDFRKSGKRYFISIKSGPNWGNSSQIKEMVNQFNSVRGQLRTHKIKEEIEFVNGCCYGKINKHIAKGDYYKICGKSFWELISGEPDLYKKIIEPLGHEAGENNLEFETELGAVRNRLTKEFIDGFCKPDGIIDWDKLIEYNSKN